MNLVSGSGTPIETDIRELFYLTNLHLENQFSSLPQFKNLFDSVPVNPENKMERVYMPKNRKQMEEILSSYISYYDPEKQMIDKGSSGFPKVFYQNVKVPIHPDREQMLIDVVGKENQRMNPPDEKLKFLDPEEYKKKKSLYYTAVSRLVSSQFSNYYYPKVNAKELKEAIRNPLTKYQKEQEKIDKEMDEFLSEMKKEDKIKGKIFPADSQADLPLEIEEGSEETLDELTEELGKEFSNKDTAVSLRIMDLPKEDGGWLTEEQLEDLYENGGEKIEQILEDIQTQEGKHAVYTRFKTYYGSRLLGSLLELKGIPYVFFDGDMNDDDRIKVLEAFNSPENINGDKIKVIILTSAGSAGINLKEIRRFHLLEQYFNLSYLKQVIGRGVRYLSHERLPEHKRNITIRNYFLDLSTPEKTQAYSPDVLLYQVAKSKDNKISKIREMIQTFGI
jgi:predicted hydrocarbon binding protein